MILLAALLVEGAWAGGGWFLAARDRDAAQMELVDERAKSAAYAAAVGRQNEAVAALADAKREADVRGAGRRYDGGGSQRGGAQRQTG
ncbi:hypothetical protein F2P45_32195 [Massilia sp. CCM 8733]|uniref:Uncharacterized protein n=1 Tax=Massilia mucilaginosa TaxID=2609282 RepID=A0ABX0P2Y1_9BURK|nr:hypothetical protein [Massilia mucilaginosa]NHZ93625.1 hypothetical protein [Massilia mucilaginosa]